MVSVSAKNNPRNYGIARNCGSGLRHCRTLLSPVLSTFLVRSRRLEVHSGRKKERAHERETREGRRSVYPRRPTISAFSRSHVSYKSDKFWTASDGRKLRRIQRSHQRSQRMWKLTIAFTALSGSRFAG